jgi:CDP-2,3-bis-(O-geranylgeranyl)-sn-glycerol synthase
MLQSIWFYLPAAIANMAPVLVLSIPWNTPLWEQGLGPNKTWRGIIAGVFASVLVVLLQTYLAPHLPQKLLTVSYEDTHPILLGILLGAGALGGDAIKSYFKRRLGIASGEKWWPFDQIDFIIGSTICVSLIFWPGLSLLAVALSLTMFLHPAINQIGFRLGLKKVPW